RGAELLREAPAVPGRDRPDDAPARRTGPRQASAGAAPWVADPPRDRGASRRVGPRLAPTDLPGRLHQAARRGALPRRRQRAFFTDSRGVRPRPLTLTLRPGCPYHAWERAARGVAQPG